jgi:hypothetical protein
MIYLVKTDELTALEIKQPVRQIKEVTESTAKGLIETAVSIDKPKMWREATKDEIDAYHQYHKTGPYLVVDSLTIEKRKGAELDKQLSELKLKKENDAKIKELAELQAAEKSKK